MNKKQVAPFFKYARERQSILLRRRAGEPAPYTKDPILQKYRFCNVFREDDKTTMWFREHVRDPLKNKPEVLLATVLFRMLNRITTGEAIFLQEDLDRVTAFEKYVRGGDIRDVKRAIVNYVGKRGPFVTGAYIITGFPGPKLDGVLKVVDTFRKKSEWESAASNWLSDKSTTLEEVWSWLTTFPHLGVFHSYEIVTDLRHTALLSRAPDIMTWANPGPGARRGLNRIMGREINKRVPREQCIEEMRELLKMSLDAKLWPANWPRWDMRTVEHLACEFDKYERTRLGQGRPRGVFSK